MPSYKVIISKRAERNLDQLVNFLESNWSIRIRDKFLATLKEKVNQITKMPLMYQTSTKSKTIRRCVVTKQTTLFYQIKKDEIEIITIQDNRQDPIKLRI